MTFRRRLRSGSAALVVAAAIAGAVPGHALAVTSGLPTEVTTLPAPQLAAFRGDMPLVAGASGFLHQEQGLPGYTWTDYASGTDTPQPQLTAVPLTNTNFFSAGGDHVAYQNGATLGVGDPTVAGSWVSYDLSSLGGTLLHTVVAVGANGTRALVRETGGAHLLQLNADGTSTEVAMTGLPSSTDYINDAVGYQSVGDYVTVRSTPKPGVTGTTAFYLVRLDTGAATAVTAVTPRSAVAPTVHGDYLTWPSNGGISLVTVADALAGSTVTPTQVLAPAGSGMLLDYDVVGQQVVMMTRVSSGALVLNSVPIAGGPATQLDATVTEPAPSARVPDYLPKGPGGALVVGGTSTSQAVQRLTAATDGSVNVTVVRQLPPPAETTATLSMAHGQVRQVLTVPQLNAATRFAMATTPLTGSGSTIGKTTTGYLSDGGQPLQAGPCTVDAFCVRETDGNSYGPVYTTTTATSARVFISGLSPETFSSPDTRVVDADSEFVLIDSAGSQYLWEPGQSAMIPLGPASGATVWMGTLWRATAPGQIQASTPHTGLGSAPALQRTISTGASCTPSEVQVAQHWLYWSCGSSGPAGVYDLATNVKFSVDAGPVLLGDGYLVRHDAASGELRLTDVHADSVGATSVLATLSQAAGASDDRGIDWTVDRTGGDVAYTGSDNIVHVLSTGVPASPVAANAGAWSNSITPGQAWNFRFEASRPLASWQLVIRRATTGQVVYSYTGGPTAAQGSTSWNGILQAKTAAFNGSYDWQLLAVPADAPGAAATQAASGTMGVFYGRMPFHSYGENGRSTMLGVLKQSAFGYRNGYGMDYEGNGHGGYSSPVASSYWNLGTGSGQLNAVVPFGDINGDGFNDILVRTSGGELEYYPNQAAGGVLNNTSPKAIGGGWNIYNRLVSVGDLNRDGHDDLIARDASGELWMYPGTGRGGFGSRVALGGGWNTYTRIVGVGDVNGDGNGDLLAVDTAGGLWRYLGNGKGGFNSRVKIGTGYQIYTAMVGVGDMNGHGLNSVVARDTSGVLWRYDFTASGSLLSRVRIGNGWNIFSDLY
ncbi:FG-GAP-like repeat-containing protein [Streptomyces sp. TP-A0356]|uniref:FG-GAP-like repeat-containing protein n=1 Tax=Streptomyces sp. TP-A0356 TaxID=1359208 RepID=UPI00131D855D|nr:FG-GAP-like repeat-containing protein [Streptomyces sp. TP-A0356]